MDKKEGLDKLTVIKDPDFSVNHLPCTNTTFCLYKKVFYRYRCEMTPGCELSTTVQYA